MAALPPPPPKKFLPLFAWWCFERQLKGKDIARALGCSIEAARRWRLAFGDPKRRTPEPPMMDKIARWTGGEVQPGSFYPSAEVSRQLEGRRSA